MSEMKGPKSNVMSRRVISVPAAAPSPDKAGPGTKTRAGCAPDSVCERHTEVLSAKGRATDCLPTASPWTLRMPSAQIRSPGTNLRVHVTW